MALANGDLKECWTLRDQSPLSLISLVGPLLAFLTQGNPAHLPLGTAKHNFHCPDFFVCVGLTVLPSLTFNSWPHHPKQLEQVVQWLLDFPGAVRG